MSNTFTDIQTAKEYAFAGNAIITLQSRKTNVHYTYKVGAKKGEDQSAPNLFFVRLLMDGNNDGSYSYIGIVDNQGFRWTKNSAVPADAPSIKAFDFFLNATEMPASLLVRHENVCGRCGRRLTTPASIDSGLGPECSKK